MKSYHNIDLYKFNTMRLHCIADEVLFPETLEELKIAVCGKKNYYVIGAGSNIVLPSKLHKTVISLRDFATELSFIEEVVVCSSAVRIQHLIRESQKYGFGGIEYLYSVPCSVGGAIFMNAGRGKEYYQSIGNFVEWVECFNTLSCKTEILRKQDCNFEYRSSIFHDKKRIILRVGLRLKKQEFTITESKIKERILYSYEKLDASRPSCGSIFYTGSGKIIKLLKGLRIGGAKYSKKTNNWISNVHYAKNWQVRFLIHIGIFLHRILFRPYKLEIEIWR